MVKKQVLEWIEFSQRDFDSANFLMNMRPLPCASLTNYATVVRYPYSSISQIDESQTKIALAQAKQILDFANNIVSVDKI